MLNDALLKELLAMRAEDVRVRQELADSGELGGSYVPRIEAVHTRNAERSARDSGEPQGGVMRWDEY